jgi:hypothetical protein
MAEFLVTVPELKITDTYVEAQKPAHAAKRVIDEHDNEGRSLRAGIMVVVKDHLGETRKYVVHGAIKNSAEEVKQ